MVTGMNPTRQFDPVQAALSAARGWSGDAGILQAQLLCLQHHSPEDLVEPQPVPSGHHSCCPRYGKQEMTVTLAYHSPCLWTLTHGSGKPSAGSQDPAMLPIKVILQNLGQLAPQPAKAIFQACLGCLPTSDVPSWIHHQA